MPTWPVTLPQDVLIDGYDEAMPATSLRSEMDQGPAKVRRRFTAGVRTFSLTSAMTRSQIDILDSFYRTDLQDGSLRFDWTHPRTQAAVEFRFVAPPSWKPQSQIDWLVQLQLEILP